MALPFEPFLARATPESRSHSGRTAGRRGKGSEGSQVYWERQGAEDDLCKMHALNAFFGRPALSVDRFRTFACEFDRSQGLAPGTSFAYYCVGEDPDVDNVFSYIISRVCGPRKFSFSARGETEGGDEVVAVFEFDSEHVWVWKAVGPRGSWVRIDSRTGPSRPADTLRLHDRTSKLFVSSAQQQTPRGK